MGFAPRLDTLHVVRLPKLVPVLRFRQPPTLAGGMTRPLTGRLATVLLKIATARVRLLLEGEFYPADKPAEFKYP